MVFICETLALEESHLRMLTSIRVPEIMDGMMQTLPMECCRLRKAIHIPYTLYTACSKPIAECLAKGYQQQTVKCANSCVWTASFYRAAYRRLHVTGKDR
ncbi:hypothetical protein I7I53_10718 [Histoplasma capsulatum var. duboisii H88]|uniref:Uncharacterized protein n=1 Tax=Ajellomyces capsulatus (strain H88) TaxID=544711 RepID=A0A8A1L6W7_AJEC8|nr:hypothetical protein I7I53_10718 [Histoplasma capsulatum var. duboisii H88]